MIIKQEILKYASTQVSFSRKELLSMISSLGTAISTDTVSSQLSRMVSQGLIVRNKRGEYALGTNKPQFICFPNQDINNLFVILKSQFPFAKICIWTTKSLAPLMHHVPNVDCVLCDVEREASESVFEYLSSLDSKRRLFLRPTELEINRYLSSGPSLIVRNLTSEAPISLNEGTIVPKIEKILVDIAGDNEFLYLHGSELNWIYENALGTYNVNINNVLRYARRRGREEEVKSLVRAANDTFR